MQHRKYLTEFGINVNHSQIPLNDSNHLSHPANSSVDMQSNLW